MKQADSPKNYTVSAPKPANLTNNKQNTLSIPVVILSLFAKIKFVSVKNIFFNLFIYLCIAAQTKPIAGLRAGNIYRDDAEASDGNFIWKCVYQTLDS